LSSSFIVDIWSKIFQILRYISWFELVRRIRPSIKGKPDFVEKWVLGNLIISVALFLGCFTRGLQWWEIIAIAYVAIRVFEIVVNQVNVLLFDEYRDRKAGLTYSLAGYRRIVILSFHNYAEIIFWFALLYLNIEWAFVANGVHLDQILPSLNLSFVTMTAFSQTEVHASHDISIGVTLVQSFIGLIMALLIISRFLSFIRNPASSDELEK
jgi:hypothetical protein